jgi:hypothetical protein
MRLQRFVHGFERAPANLGVSRLLIMPQTAHRRFIQRRQQVKLAASADNASASAPRCTARRTERFAR